MPSVLKADRRHVLPKGGAHVKIEMEPTCTLHIEGDNSGILTALRRAGLMEHYEHFLADRTRLCDDDADAGVVGSVPIRTLTELANILPVLTYAKAKVCLFIAGGDKDAGFSVFLGDGKPQHETGAVWYADTALFSKKIAEVAEATRKLLDELLTK
jgi:hypothetical protein